MDFTDIIHDLRDKGYTFEDIAKNFTTELNRIEKTNKSIVERKNYITSIYNNACNAIKEEKITFATVGEVAALAAASQYHELTVEKLKEYEKATAAAAEATVKFDIELGEGKDPVDSFLKVLFDDMPTKEKKPTDKTDDAVIAKFVRALG